ncbi:hypothetical protein OG896_24370 [Streptomyces sp. NBC_00669]|uniref:hypothetical protein n=1 Tax=Streptomyces sp. NBC_00669 TaxID=2976011 RepID=UPI002E355550|nr:hypothetical protein [Streptomyces sp. NBC_00669]
MPPPSTAADTEQPPVDAINTAIRQLMDRPASAERTEEYVRLLTLWAGALGDWDTAA